MSTCLRCSEPIDPGATVTVGLLCAACAKLVDEIRAEARFDSRADGDRQVIEIHRRRTPEEPASAYRVTGEASSVALAHFCVYFLTSLGLLDDDAAGDIGAMLGPMPPHEPVADTAAAPSPDTVTTTAVHVIGDPAVAPAAPTPPAPPAPPAKKTARLRAVQDLPPAPSAAAPRVNMVTSATGGTVATMPDDDDDMEPAS